MDIIQEAIKLVLSAHQNVDNDYWVKAFCRMPGLLFEETIHKIGTELNRLNMPKEMIEFAKNLILQHGQNAELLMRTKPWGYPLGEGPIEHLYFRHKKGHIGVEVAKHEARNLVLQKNIHPSYLSALSYRCVQYSYNGKPEEAICIQTLLIAAADELSKQSKTAINSKLAVDFIRSATELLIQKGEQQIFQEAILIGNRALDQTILDEERGELNYFLGVLYLDPYSHNGLPDWYTAGIHQWFNTGNNPIGCKLGDKNSLPLPEEALHLAKSKFKTAIDLCKGNLKRDAIKALIQTLQTEQLIGIETDKKQIIRLCDEALKLMLKYPNQQQFKYVNELRKQFIQKSNLSTTDNKPLNSLENNIETEGSSIGVSSWLTSIQYLVYQNPKYCLEVISSERKLFKCYANENNKELLWWYELNALSNLVEIKNVKDIISAELLNICQIVKYALQATQNESEQDALEKIFVITDSPSKNVLEYIHSIQWLKICLLWNISGKKYNSGDYINSAMGYSLVLELLIKFELCNHVNRVLDNIYDIFIHGDEESVICMLSNLLLTSNQLIKIIGTENTNKRFDTLARCLIYRLSTNNLPLRSNTVLLRGAIDLAKGRFFNSLLNSGISSIFEPEIDTLKTLTEVFKLEKRVSNKNGKELFDETLIASFYTETISEAGRTANSQLRSLRHHFDKSISYERIQKIVDQNPIINNVESIIKKIPKNTVLFDNYEAGRFSLSLAYTSEGVNIFAIDNAHWNPIKGFQTIQEDDTLSASINYYSKMIKSLRELICNEPGPFEVDQKARSMLDKILIDMIGKGVDHLQKWWDMGKRHLCFIPHGAHHFLPIHLLTWNRKPLAEQWCVTYLPNIALISKDWKKDATKQSFTSKSNAALGLTYSEHPFLATIENSVSEVHSVAKAMRVSPDLDEVVTKSKVKETLNNCSYIHLSCHGKIYSEAPELQHLYLAQDSTNQERLFAFEISGMDLNHVELISLSACQSGLGRFDQGDNLRGIQANLFISGVSSIVDTLWDVNANAAEKFFSVFYEQMNNGCSKLSAFQIAQKKTRLEYKAYRDWGAFRFSGKW